jgi:biotin carboxyl carrier protein
MTRYRLLGHNRIEIDGKIHRYYVVRDRTSCTVWLDGRTYRLERTDKAQISTSTTAPAGGNITALMPGKLLRLEVAVGDSVAEKQTVAIMESMKMESALHAPRAGRVAEIRCQPGQVVEMGEVLMVIE